MLNTVPSMRQLKMDNNGCFDSLYEWKLSAIWSKHIISLLLVINRTSVSFVEVKTSTTKSGRREKGLKMHLK